MARMVFALFCLSILLLAGMAMADDPETTKTSFENQFQARAGIFPGEISDPDHPGMLMSVEGKFDHPAETEALREIQLFPYNGDGYIDNGVQKTYNTPLTPAFRPQINNTHLGNANRDNIELGLLHESG